MTVYKRLGLVVLAVAPGVAIAGAETGWIGFSIAPTLALGGASVLSGLTVFLASRGRSDEANRQKRRGALLRKGALKALSDELPRLADQRAHLTQALAAQSLVVPGLTVVEPETEQDARAHLLQQALGSLDSATIETARDDTIQQLYLLTRVFDETPGEAARLAAYFRVPADVLDLRDTLIETAQARAAFERQRAVYEATQVLWTTRESKTGSTMRDRLAALGTADPDLWHHVVCEHDLTDPDQSKAALWCLTQPGCDRATLAAYLRRIVVSGHLEQVAAANDMDALNAIGACFDRWTQFDGPQLLQLAGSEDADAQKDQMTAALDAVKAATGQVWRAPMGVFDAIDGRVAQTRDNWCLVTGTPIAPPRFDDYIALQDQALIAA